MIYDNVLLRHLASSEATFYNDEMNIGNFLTFENCLSLSLLRCDKFVNRSIWSLNVLGVCFTGVKTVLVNQPINAVNSIFDISNPYNHCCTFWRTKVVNWISLWWATILPHLKFFFLFRFSRYFTLLKKIWQKLRSTNNSSAIRMKMI